MSGLVQYRCVKKEQPTAARHARVVTIHDRESAYRHSESEGEHEWAPAGGVALSLLVARPARAGRP